MTELATRLPGSAETWREAPAEPRVPPTLVVPEGLPVGARLRAWQDRHLEREQRARDNYTRSRNP